MAVSEEYLTYILEMLEGIGDIQTKHMFSGVLLTVDEQQLGIILNEVLYFKVTDQALHTRFAKEGSVQFSYTRKDKKNPVVIKNWWSAPEEYIDDQEKMQSLAKTVLLQ